MRLHRLHAWALLLLAGVGGCDETDEGGEPDVSDIDPCVLSADDRGDAIGEERFHFCPAQCSTSPNIWGTTMYTSDSPLCVAAIHAGVIAQAAGGPVTYQLLAGLPRYEGSTANGVTSQSWDDWPMSITFVAGGPPLDPSGGGESSGGFDPDTGPGPDLECGALDMPCCEGVCDAGGLVPLVCVDDICTEEVVPDCDGNGDGTPHASCTEDFQCVAYDAAKDGTNEDFCVGPDLTPCDGNNDGLYQQFCWPDLMCTQFEGEDHCMPW